ncbi:MAG: sigma-70 family RNA polymerase sigma factor [Verrucomicrobiaceae bacterium]|nr:sigma-70 family RNA polymerase sigma factor [Verrucomicrobiaceae bacterium]
MPSSLSNSPPYPFPATMWSKVLRTRDEPAARQALDQLCTLYWLPVVGYVRALGCAADEAEDVAQEFFAMFLRREGFRRAEQERGTLRSYLKSAIRHHVLHWVRDRSAQRRGGGVAAVALDAEDVPEIPVNDEPAMRYDEEWAVTVMERALAATKESYARRGKPALFEALKPALMQSGDGDCAAIAKDLGMTRGAFAVELHRARRRLADLLREEVAQTVTDPADVDAELLHLLRVLARTEVAS